MKCRDIAKLLMSRIELHAAPASVDHHACEVLVREGRCVSLSDARTHVDAVTVPLGRLIRNAWNKSGEQGHPTRFALIDTPDGDFIVAGICYVTADDGPDEIAAKGRREWSIKVADTLLRGTTPAEFELLCAKVLVQIGVDCPKVTRSSRDDGIDFFGQLNVVSEKYIFDVSPTVEKQLNVWIVGQAKHYPDGQAGTPDLRHLFGSVQLARAGVFASNSFTSTELTLRAADPVIFLFLTTGSLSSDAWRVCTRAGIVSMDGNMLSAFLADRDLGPTICDPTKYLAWLHDS